MAFESWRRSTLAIKRPPPDAVYTPIDGTSVAIPPGLSNTEFDQQLGDSFRRTPFVIEFVELLKTEKSLRFGAVNDWIYRMCEDVPFPYRWDIKENTRIFYNWLEHYFTEIVWDRPNYSQVIYWREGRA
jgi:hypothetical protein